MRSAAAVVLSFVSAGALAHPGHAVADFWHLLTEPDHLAMVVLPWVVAMAVVHGWRRVAARRIRREDGRD